MIEPEMAFYDLNDNMELAEEFLKYLVNYALENCQEDYENNVLPFVLRGRYLDSKIFSVSEQDDLFDNFKLDSKIRADVYKDLVTSEEFDHVVHGMVSGSIISRKILTGAKVSVKMLLDLINEELKN